MSQARFIHDGESLDFVPGVTVPAGSVVTMNGGTHRLAGIATREIPVNTLGALALKGVFEVPCAQDNFDYGVTVYWNTETLQAQTAPPQALEAVFLGVAVSRRVAQPDGSSVVRVLLVPVWTA